MVERRRTDVGASQNCRFSASQRRHRQCTPGWEVNWSAYQTRVNEDESAEGRSSDLILFRIGDSNSTNPASFSNRRDCGCGIRSSKRIVANETENIRG